MPLTWGEGNLLTHTAKHYVGSPEERWRELGAAPLEAWEDWRSRAEDAGCRFDEHPARCRQAAACEVPHREAAVPYRALVDQDWVFAELRPFFVYYRDEGGAPCRCGTGPRGIFIAVVERPTGERVAKTAFRPMAKPSGGPDPVLAAVRKMRAHASQGHGGQTVADLLQLETRLLRPRPSGSGPYDQLAHDLRKAP